ncbi:hypothetical protein QJS10_CPA01g01486 [Acorus calamus]|uniref:Uncharacterized protein n=1 Tax=Acorus calamus TaxID=4465 RepID=A0AAV9FLU4_ACOCL|nr:hypothetical protein QJS10_CPA01g01486 [Acorus calamus]
MEKEKAKGGWNFVSLGLVGPCGASCNFVGPNINYTAQTITLIDTDFIHNSQTYPLPNHSLIFDDTHIFW